MPRSAYECKILFTVELEGDGKPLQYISRGRQDPAVFVSELQGGWNLTCDIEEVRHTIFKVLPNRVWMEINEPCKGSFPGTVIEAEETRPFSGFFAEART